jgi:4-hydroxythreonine-4-phosphate dehydrogenase
MECDIPRILIMIKPSIAVSMGDCNGIGLEVFARALHTFGNPDALPCAFLLATNADTLADYARKAHITCNFYPGGVELAGIPCTLLACEQSAPVEFGAVTREAGTLAMEALEKAVTEALAGRADAVLTLPVSKFSMKRAGYTFPGQTEYLADRCGIRKPMMILCTSTVRVGLVTIHIPISEVPAGITRQRVYEHIYTLHASLRKDFGCLEPRIAVLGLNPHAGEGGDIGSEDMEQIAPAVERCQNEGIAAEGPLPADGFFAHGMYRHFDGIPLKLLASGGGVNFTAGLPLVRTSPDHGTAFAIAGKNMADPASTLEAIRMAVDIVASRRKV